MSHESAERSVCVTKRTAAYMSTQGAATSYVLPGFKNKFQDIV